MEGQPSPPWWTTRALSCAWLGACFGLVYIGDIGRGFVKDDFSWILNSRIGAGHELWPVLTEAPMGFYRPLVSLSFSLDYFLFDLAPFGYALTNLGLAVGTALVLALVVKRLGLNQDTAIVAAGLWLFNVHGINMSLMWISGRTSLVAALWASLAAWAFTARRFKLTGFLVLLSLMSKEEPLLLPVVLVLWALIDTAQTPPTRRVREIIAAVWPSAAGLAIYLILRSSTAAFTPATAPSFYRLTLDPLVILGNTVSYLDRSLTFATAIVVLTALACGRLRVGFVNTERAAFLKGLAWLVCGFGLTVWVPVRSSLYVCLPSIGSALMGSAVIAALCRTAPLRRRRAAVMLLLLMPVALFPIYRSRNARLKAEAMLSSEVVGKLVNVDDGTRSMTHVVLYDNPDLRPSFRDAFASAFPDAVRLLFGDGVTGEIVSREGEPSMPEVSEATVVLELDQSGLVQRR